MPITLKEPHKLQKAIMQDTHRFRVVDCGRRWGKTMMAMLEAFWMCYWRYEETKIPQRGWIVAPTFPMVRENWMQAEVLLKDVISNKKQTEMRMDFSNIGFIEFKSAEREDEGLRGAGLDFCYHPDTEVLTELGWLKIEEIVKNKNIKVASVDYQTLHSKYMFPKNYITKDFDGELFHFNSRNYEVLVTPEHRMLIDRRISGGWKTQRYERKFVEAKNFKPLVDFIPHRINWMGEEKGYFEIKPEIIYENQYDKIGIRSKRKLKIKMDDWLAFFGLWLAEGYVTGCNGGKIDRCYRVGISQLNKDNRKNIEEILLKLPFKFSKTEQAYRTSNKQLWKYLNQFGNSHSKYVPNELKGLSVRQINILLQWYFMGDGNFSRNKFTFASCSKKLAVDIQELVFKTGKNCSLRFNKPQTSILNGRKILNTGIWIGEQLKTNRSSFIKPKNIEKIKYSGKVYCLEVDGNVLITRFNNKISLCGNCIIDEASRVSRKSWEQGIRPALADKRGRGLFISTPKGKNWFYDYYRLGQSDNKEIKSWMYPTFTNPYFPKEEWDNLLKTTPQLILKQEFLADFLDDEASVFKNLNKCMRGSLEEGNDKEHYTIGLDLGRTEDFTVAIVLRNSDCQLVEIYKQNQVDWSLQKQQVKALCKRYKNHLVYVDSTGLGDPIEEDLRKSGIKTRAYQFTNQSKHELVEQLMVGIEQGLIGIPDCLQTQFLIEELKSFSYEILPSGRIKYSAPEGLHDDGVMALGLAAMGISYRFYKTRAKPEDLLPRNSPAWLERESYKKELEVNAHLPRRFRKTIGELAFS